MIRLNWGIGINRVANTYVSRALSFFGMRLTSIKMDFEQYPLNVPIQRSLFRELAASAETWHKDQDCFDAIGCDTESAVRHFLFCYLKSPFRQPFGPSPMAR